MTSQAQADELLRELLPRQGDWNDDAYLWLTDYSNRLIECTDGFLEVLPRPTDRHQSVLAHLYDLLRDYTRGGGGKVLFAPLRLRIRPGKFREPDLLFVRDAHDQRRQDRYWLGADLVMEVISPDNPQRDLVEKRSDYAEAEVPEYWLVDPEEETVTVLWLEGSQYREDGAYARGDVARSRLLEFAVEVSQLFGAQT